MIARSYLIGFFNDRSPQSLRGHSNAFSSKFGISEKIPVNFADAIRWTSHGIALKKTARLYKMLKLSTVIPFLS